uniref:DUF1501 domain-containing protein n=1 Tax=Ditylum brightwellii TaxID=49249 RepID=A0A7S4RJB1_9STRA
MTTPEFHTNNLAKKNGLVRDEYKPPENSNNSYKALVYIMLSGGCDSFNVLVPYTCNGTTALYDEYASERGSVKLDRNSLHVISAGGQVCSEFGLHGSLNNIHDLYTKSELLFFANTGVITKPSTKMNYWQNSKTALFGHDSMQREAKRINPYDSTAQTGVLGRMADVMTADNYTFGSFSIDWHSEALVGKAGMSPAPSTVSQHGTNAFNSDSLSVNMNNRIIALNEATSADSGVFSEQWSAEMLHSLLKNEALHSALSGTTIETNFPDNHLGRQLKMVTRLIATRETRRVDRDVFFVQMGGFDTHHTGDLNSLFSQLDEAIGAFTKGLKELGVWESVTTVQLSDFGRTLVPNSGGGTDHGW